MKKLCLLIAIVITILTLSQNAFAIGTDVIDGEDPLNSSDPVPAHIREQLECNPEDSVILIYNVPLRETARYPSIKAYLCDDSVLHSAIYMVTEPSGKVTYRWVSENSNRPGISDGDIFAVDEITKERLNNYQNIIADIIPDVVVENAYFLNSQTSYSGIAIVYETSHGDFVYHFNTKDLQYGVYFFTWDALCKTQLAIIEKEVAWMKEHGEYWAGSAGFDMPDYLDLSIYDMNSPNFSPLSDPGNIFETMPKTESPKPTENKKPTKVLLWAGIPCIAVLVIVGAVFGLKKKRKG